MYYHCDSERMKFECKWVEYVVAIVTLWFNMHVVDNSSSRGVMTKCCRNLEVTCTRLAGSSERYAGDSWYYCLSTQTRNARCRHCCRLTMSHSLIRREITWHLSYLEPFYWFLCTDLCYIAHLGTSWFQGHNIQFTIPLFSFRTVSPCHGLLRRKLGFNPRQVHGGFMVDKEAVG